MHSDNSLHTQGGDSTPWPHRERRRRRYVDFRMQTSMLIALIILEIGSVIGALCYLYWRFNSLIRAQLYRIHHDSDSLFTLLLTEVGTVLFCLLGINLLAIFVADRIWGSYVRRVLGAFRTLSNRVADLDFRSEHPPPTKHEVLVRMLTWRSKERVRLRTIREGLQALSAEEPHTPQARERLRQQLQKIAATLPDYSRHYVKGG
ncbi:MAG: hypothetical protein HQL88_03345 [Magnetococcales bacterium]|nr:hypothetical protein [Magnetococcales bacterium]